MKEMRMPTETTKGRLSQMAEMRAEGASYAIIGGSFGISGERVSQILSKGHLVDDSAYSDWKAGSDFHRACTLAGLANARANGRTGGRPAKFSNELILEIRRMGLARGASHLGMTAVGFYKAVKRARSKLMSDPSKMTERPYSHRCVTCVHDHFQNEAVGDCQAFGKDVYHHNTEACAKYERSRDAD